MTLQSSPELILSTGHDDKLRFRDNESALIMVLWSQHMDSGATCEPYANNVSSFWKQILPRVGNEKQELKGERIIDQLQAYIYIHIIINLFKCTFTAIQTFWDMSLEF